MSTVPERCWCGGRVGSGEVRFNGQRDTIIQCLDSKFHDPSATGRPERVTRLYVAGPMTGYPDCNYPAFNEMSTYLRDAGYEVLNPAEAVTGTEAHYVDFIREDLRMLLDCHGVATLDAWWESPGARNEVQVAGILKMPVRPASEWLERARQELTRA